MNDYKKTPEWIALNHIWKNSTKETQQFCYQDFKIITKMIESYHNMQVKQFQHNKDGYLSALSDAAKNFVRNHTPNMYHSMMAILDNNSFSSENEFVAFYIEKYRIKRPYLEENRELTEEVAKLCFYKYKGKNQ